MSRPFRSANFRIVAALGCALGILALLCSRCEAYTGLIPPDPENPGKCIYRGDTLKLGINHVNTPCQRLTCNEDGSMLVEGCGKLRIQTCNNGERIHGDKPFPECCKLKYKCKQPDGTPYYIERDSFNGSEINKVKRST